MFKSFLKTLLVITVFAGWFGGIIFFYDQSGDEYKMTYRARKDQAAINLLQSFEIFEDTVATSSVSTVFTPEFNQ